MKVDLFIPDSKLVDQPAEQRQVAPVAPEQSQVGQDGNLTEQDLKAFKADKFELRKIPEVAPPPSLCGR